MSLDRPLRYGPNGGNPNRIRVFKLRGAAVFSEQLSTLFGNLGRAISRPGAKLRKTRTWGWTCPCIVDLARKHPESQWAYRTAESQSAAFAAAAQHAMIHWLDRAERRDRR